MYLSWIWKFNETIVAEAFKKQVLKLGKQFSEKKTKNEEKLWPVRHRKQSLKFQESTWKLKESEKSRESRRDRNCLKFSKSSLLNFWELLKMHKGFMKRDKWCIILAQLLILSGLAMYMGNFDCKF